MGEVKSRCTTIWNSFELPFEVGKVSDSNLVSRDSELELDLVGIQNHLKSKIEQYKQVFPNLEFVGWYSVNPGSEISLIDSVLGSVLLLELETDSKLHQMVRIEKLFTV